LKEKTLYAPAIGELLIFTKCTVGYIEGEEALCPNNSRVAYFSKRTVGYIEGEEALCPSNRRVAYFYKVYCRIY